MLPCFVLPVLEHCSAVWCSAADTHLKLLDRAVSGVRFLTGGVVECDIAHHRSVAVLCILYKIRCNPMHLLNDVLPGLYVQVQVTLAALVTHQYTYVPPRCQKSQYRRTCSPLSVPLQQSRWLRNFDGDWRVSFKSRANAFFWPELLIPYYILLFFPFSSFCL